MKGDSGATYSEGLLEIETLGAESGSLGDSAARLKWSFSPRLQSENYSLHGKYPTPRTIACFVQLQAKKGLFHFVSYF